ncbi:MAG: secretion system protein [Chloroflexi bacterium]|nr:secretion system protein [Chloroflexota bacterium]
MNQATIISLFVAAAIIAFSFGVYQWLQWVSQLEERMQATLPSVRASSKGPSSTVSERLNQYIAATSVADKTQHKLAKADLNITPTEYLVMRVGVTAFAFIMGWVISRHIAGSILLSLVGWYIPAFYVHRRYQKRIKAFNEQLPDVISLLVGSLRAGYGLLHAITVVVEEMPEPSATEFGRVLREVSIGYSMDDALDHLVERVNSDDLEMMVISIHVQNEVGGNLAEVLETIGETIRDRIRLLGEIRSLTAQQRMTGTVLTAMPFLLAVILMLINPDYMMGMFEPGWPRLIPASAVVMMLMGYFIMQKVIQLDV